MPEINQVKKKTKEKPPGFKFSEERVKWKEFRETWKDCESCPLHTTRHRICLAKGSVPCDVLFVGEAPGKSEDVSGLPFDGPAGALLHQMISDTIYPLLASYQSREETPINLRIAFTNIVCCIPLDESGDKVAEPEPAHAKACSPRLIEFIDKVAQPKAIIFVGKYAAKWVKKLYPKTQSWTTAEITHPAAILRADVGQQGLLIQRSIITIREVFEEVVGQC